MDVLTPRQQEILDYIRDFQDRYGYPPSRREVAGHFGIYPGSVQDHLKALIRKGRLKREPNRSRGLSLKPGSAPLRTVPRYGSIPAGGPRLVPEEAEDRVTLPADWARGEEVFLLRVQGESMKPTILSGDQVIVRRLEQLPEGAVGVFRVENEVTLKRWHRQGEGVLLKGDNPSFEPLVIKKKDLADLGIIGQVIGIYRPVI
ncbi:MAG: repressor LexA [Deltaproteobacteria bacterium]|nr:repressor LexA [Deltaproteobacteria bacterium]